MPVYKTVRSRKWQSHPWPNVLRLETAGEQENCQLSSTEGSQQPRPKVRVLPLSQQDLRDPYLRDRLSITNAFGVPSLSAKEWGDDYSHLNELAYARGRCTVLSFQGTRESGSHWHDFLDDTSRTAQMAAQCVNLKGGRILEMNVSCPNESGAPIYTDINALAETLRAAAEGLSGFPDIRLIIKLGVVPEGNILKTVELVARYAHGVSAINTVSATIVTPDGSRALGSGAEHGGVCGSAIREQSLRLLTQLQSARQSLGLLPDNFALIGVGGISSAQDVQRFLDAGVDVVHAATGAMWNLQFAAECARVLNVKFENRNSL
jgi:dihydroorotate dehydrogenase